LKTNNILIGAIWAWNNSESYNTIFTL